MTNAPYYKIVIDGDDISPRVTSFSYEDCISQDDLMKISIKGVDTEYIDKDILKVGKEIKFQFGYYGGRNSGIRLARISDVDYSYGKTIDVSITAIDLGQLMKKNQSSKIWSGKTASEIVSEIVGQYGLKDGRVQKTERVYETLPQANRTDFEFCKYLASIEENGSFRFFIKDEEVCFGKIELGQETSFKFTFGKDVVSFKPALKDSQTTGAVTQTEVSSYDPVTKQTVTATADKETVQEEKLLGKKEIGTDTHRQTDSGNGQSKIQSYDADGNPI